MVFLLAFYDAFYMSPAKAKRAAAIEAARAARRSSANTQPDSVALSGSSGSSGVRRQQTDGTSVDGSSGGAAASPARKQVPQHPLWEGT